MISKRPAAEQERLNDALEEYAEIRFYVTDPPRTSCGDFHGVQAGGALAPGSPEAWQSEGRCCSVIRLSGRRHRFDERRRQDGRVGIVGNIRGGQLSGGRHRHGINSSIRDAGCV